MKLNASQVTLSLFVFISPPVLSSPFMYVPTGDANKLIVIDLQTNQITKRIDELENAHGLAAVPSQDYLVAGSMDTALSKGLKKQVKPAQMTEAEHKTHHSGKEPVAASYISIVHPEHGHVMRRIAVKDRTHHIAVDPKGKYAIGTHSNLGGISVIDLEKMVVIKTIKTGQVANFSLFNHDGTRLYVSNAGSGTVTELDTGNWSVIKNIIVEKGPEHLAIDSNSQRLYVLNVISGTVSEIDLVKGIEIRTIKVGKAPHGLALSAADTDLFVSNKGSETLTSINLSTASSRSIEMSPAPYHVTYVSALNKLYVSSRKQPKIWVVNPTTMDVENEINLGKKGVAHQMVIR